MALINLLIGKKDLDFWVGGKGCRLFQTFIWNKKNNFFSVRPMNVNNKLNIGEGGVVRSSTRIHAPPGGSSQAGSLIFGGGASQQPQQISSNKCVFFFIFFFNFKKKFIFLKTIIFIFWSWPLFLSLCSLFLSLSFSGLPRVPTRTVVTLWLDVLLHVFTHRRVVRQKQVPSFLVVVQTQAIDSVDVGAVRTQHKATRTRSIKPRSSNLRLLTRSSTTIKATRSSSRPHLLQLSKRRLPRPPRLPHMARVRMLLQVERIRTVVTLLRIDPRRVFLLHQEDARLVLFGKRKRNFYFLCSPLWKTVKSERKKKKGKKWYLYIIFLGF